MQIPPEIRQRWREIDAFEIQFNGKTTARIGLTVHAYVFDADTAPVRRRLLAAADLYRARAGKHLRHRVVDRGAWASYAPPERYDLGKAAAGVIDNPKKSWSVFFWSGENDAETDFDLAQQYQCEIVLKNTLPDYRSAGQFICNFPFSWMEEYSFIEFVQAICECLSPIFVSAGAGFVIPHNIGVYMKGFPNPSFALLPYALKYPAVECSHSGYYLDIAEGFYSVNWLTAIGDEWIARLGGREALRAALLPESMFPFRPYAGGVLIQAGKYPQFDDKHAGDDAPAYRTLNNVLRPLRIRQFNRNDLLAPPPWGNVIKEDHVRVCQEYLTRFDGSL